MNILTSLFGVQTANAATTTAVSPVTKFVGTVNRLIINPLIILMFAAALVYFLYGMVQFFLTGNPESKNEGRQHMMWGIIGMFIMFSVFAILHLIQNSLGADTIQNIN